MFIHLPLFNLSYLVDLILIKWIWEFSEPRVLFLKWKCGDFVLKRNKDLLQMF